MVVVGHRGARGLAPENTLAAITAGVAAGADELEIDVRVTSDGVPVLWHNITFDGRRISSYTLATLKKRKPDTATLEEAIAATNRRVPLIIEVKPNEPATPVIAVVEKFLRNHWQPIDFRFACKKQTTLRELHQALPDVPIIVIDRWSSFRAMWRARQLGTKHLFMNQLFLWRGVVRLLSKRGYKLSVYTLNNKRRAKVWQKHGLHGIITDHPEEFSSKSK